MDQLVGTYSLHQALEAEGYDLPKECVTATLGPMPPDGVL